MPVATTPSSGSANEAYEKALQQLKEPDFKVNHRGHVLHRNKLLPRMEFNDFRQVVTVGCMTLTYDAIEALIKEYQSHEKKTYIIT